MIDRKKVIKAVECRRNVHKRCGNPCEQIGNCEYAAWVRDSDGEPYYPCCCDTEKLCDDILLLLKEQEPMMVRLTASTIRCPKCGKQITSRGAIHREIKFCWKCGQAVKWDA